MATDSPAATHIHWAAGASPFRPQEERQAMTKTRERERERDRGSVERKIALTRFNRAARASDAS